MYLTEDIIGPYSGIVFGTKGEQVIIVNYKDGDLVLVKGSYKDDFYVQKKFLSTQFIEPNKPPNVQDRHHRGKQK